MVVQSIFQNIDSVSDVAGNRGQEALSFGRGLFLRGPAMFDAVRLLLGVEGPRAQVLVAFALKKPVPINCQSRTDANKENPTV